MAAIQKVPHPGEVLRDWLGGLTVTDAAKRLGISRASLSGILNGSRKISPDVDLRLAKALQTMPGTWYAMQGRYDMWQAQRHFCAQVQSIARTDPEDVFMRGVEEANYRERGGFEELLGQFPEEVSGLLKGILTYLRNYLLDKFPEDELRRLLDEYDPASKYRNVTPMDPDVRLAIDLFLSIRSAARKEKDGLGKLILGPAGVAGVPILKGRQEGVEKSVKSRRAKAEAEWWDSCELASRKALAEGKERKEIIKAMADRFKKSRQQVSNVLKKKGVISPLKVK